MRPEPHLSIELEPHEAVSETVKTVVLPWSGRVVSIRVPAGIADGSVLRLAGLGPPAADGSAQDAFVRVGVRAASTQPGQTSDGPSESAGGSSEPAGPAALASAPTAGSSGSPGQQPYPPLPPPGRPVRRTTVLVGVAVTIVALLACCGLPSMFLLSDDEKDGRPVATVDQTPSATPSTTPSPSVPPISPQQYQALLTETDRVLKAGFDTLAKAKNPVAVNAAAGELATLAGGQHRKLSEVVPPPTVAIAHASLVTALDDFAATLIDTGAAARSGRVCLGPAAVAQVSRELATARLRSAAQALATADPAQAYQVGSFVPEVTKDANRRLGNGSYIKRTRGGLGQLKIENGSSDTVISIVRGKTTVTRVYVRGKGTFTVRGVRDGTYHIYMTSGKDWDNRFKAFGRDCQFERFDDPLKFTTTSRTYTIWTISLRPVPGGNAHISSVDPGGFPVG